MLRAEIEAKVVQVVAKQFETTMERVKLSTSFRDDLGADSLDSIELIMDLEDTFDLTIPDEVAGDIKKVEDAVVYIESKLKK